MGTATIDGNRVDLGNPHLVVPVDDLTLVAGAVDGVNVEYVTVGPGPAAFPPAGSIPVC